MKSSISLLRCSLLLRIAALVAFVFATFEMANAAKPKQQEAKADTSKAEAAKQDAATPEATPSNSGSPLPGDLNDASLQLRALDMMYELDLSTDQLKALAQAAGGTASKQHRTAAKGNDKLVTTMHDFQAALLAGTDTYHIDELRTQLSDLTDDENVQLDDDIQITAEARNKAPDVMHQLTASQLAAYLASHADEVGDPVEMMMNTVEELRDQRTDAAAEKDAASVETPKKAANKKEPKEANSAEDEAAILVRLTAQDVANAVVGLDEAKAKTLAVDIAKWIKTTSDMKDDDFTAQRKTATVIQIFVVS
jgi:hypothetical protein